MGRTAPLGWIAPPFGTAKTGGMTTILLTGATGTVSSAAIPALRKRGHRLVGLVRDKAKAAPLEALGVELRVGALERPRTLESGAFDGVDVAWVLTPPGPLAPYQSSNAVWAARQAGVKHIVRMSAIGAAHDAPSLNGRMHSLSDAEVASSGTAYTILKPHFFMQNLLMGAKTIVEQGTLYFALGTAKLPMIDARDVGAVAAAILANPTPHAGKTYTLTGPNAVGLDNVASAIGEAVGKPVS
jgi:uncharacterized protein YbjT (DUF2867 family)